VPDTVIKATIRPSVQRHSARTQRWQQRQCIRISEVFGNPQ